MIQSIRVKRLTDTAKVPTGNHRSAGYDLYADENVTLPPGKVTVVKLGIATQLPHGFAALVWDRSGMGKKGLHIFGGVVDEDYRGEWMALIYNSTKQPYDILTGDRVAQFVVQQVVQWRLEDVKELDDSERGDQGFGSSGK